MKQVSNFSTKNHILNSIPPAAFERLRGDLERVDLPHASSVFRSYEPITHVFFPEGAIASYVAASANGGSSEIGVVGREGAAGLDVLMGVDESPHECVIQIPHGGFRIKKEALRKEFERGEEMHDMILLFTHKLMMQVSQLSLCNRLHSVEERLSRSLLMCHDRIDGDVIALTQGFLGLMLGTRRESVTMAAGALQDRGAIKYWRGNIEVLDRDELEGAACECYDIVKGEYERL